VKRKLVIGLFGFGRTGQLAAAEIVRDPECSLRWVVRNSSKGGGRYASRLLGLKGNSGLIVPLSKARHPEFLAKAPVDVIIDFSAASAVHVYGDAAAKQKTRVVTAVSKYEADELAVLERISARTAVLHSPNITVGINILMVVAQLLRRMFPDADVEVIEEHFRDKREVSGTALRLADLLGLDAARHVNSLRVGGIIGNHQVVFGMRNQTVRVVHESVTRSAFGRGAVYAAKWVRRAPHGLYRMEQVVRERFIQCLDELTA
jgi:4-hydroxy-tetrahydrodipicolinate reductase